MGWRPVASLPVPRSVLVLGWALAGAGAAGAGAGADASAGAGAGAARLTRGSTCLARASTR
jgi:hypothetical protein